MEVSPTGQSPTAAIANPNDPILLLHLLANLQSQTLEVQRQQLEIQRQQLEISREMIQVNREQRRVKEPSSSGGKSATSRSSKRVEKRSASWNRCTLHS